MKPLLAVTVVMLLTAGVCLIAAAALWPLRGADESSGATSSGIDLRQHSGDAAPLATFAPAWSRDLRRSLTDAPADASAVAAQADANPLPVRLVGTIVDPARPRGIFVTVLGQMELRAVGEKAGGVEVLRIDERSATLSIAGRPVTIKLEKPEVPIPGGGADPATPPSARSESQPTGEVVR